LANINCEIVLVNQPTWAGWADHSWRDYRYFRVIFWAAM